MKYPNIWRVQQLVESCNCNQAEVDGRWVPARPEGASILLNRFKYAWKVFTGKADIVIWDGQ